MMISLLMVGCVLEGFTLTRRHNGSLSKTRPTLVNDHHHHNDDNDDDDDDDDDDDKEEKADEVI